MAGREANRMDAALSSFGIEADNFLGACSLCCSSIWSAADSRLGTLLSTPTPYGACPA